MPDPVPPFSIAYDFVESRHLRQWAMRAVLPIALLAANGAGWVEVPSFPRHDVLGLPAAAETAVRVAGALLAASAALLRVAAKGVLVRRTELTQGGVYARVRHPFYVANLVGAAGTFLCAGSLGAAFGAVWLAAALPLFLVTIAGEEAGLRRVHGAAFERYAAEVPALLPRLRAARAARTRVTWANLWAEREPPRLLRFAGGALLVLGAASRGPAAISVTAAGVAAFAASYVVRRNVAPAATPGSPHRP